MPINGDYISKLRYPAPSPDKLVSDGKAIFGTFDKALVDINLLDCIKPAGRLLPHFLNKSRLTVWEVAEITFKEGIFLGAVYNVGLFGFSLFIFYDRRTNKTLSWMNVTSGRNAIVAPNLIDSVTELQNKRSTLIIVNNMQTGICSVKGHSGNKKSGSLVIDVDFLSVAPPSVVSIPFGKNKPLYSHKELFSVKGYLEINGERFTADKGTAAIIDDHKGYYPYRMHYDWLTAMGKIDINGKEKFFGFNLTRNQSTNQDDYNENLIWLQGKSFPLPPVTFLKERDQWRIRDEHGAVDLTFTPESKFKIQVHPLVIDIDYSLPFGNIKGVLKDPEGRSYEVDMLGMGEDKSTRM